LGECCLTCGGDGEHGASRTSIAPPRMFHQLFLQNSGVRKALRQSRHTLEVVERILDTVAVRRARGSHWKPCEQITSEIDVDLTHHPASLSWAHGGECRHRKHSEGRFEPRGSQGNAQIEESQLTHPTQSLTSSLSQTRILESMPASHLEGITYGGDRTRESQNFDLGTRYWVLVSADSTAQIMSGRWLAVCILVCLCVHTDGLNSFTLPATSLGTLYLVCDALSRGLIAHAASGRLSGLVELQLGLVS
jgi:hypothetical protein